MCKSNKCMGLIFEWQCFGIERVHLCQISVFSVGNCVHSMQNMSSKLLIVFKEMVCVL